MPRTSRRDEPTVSTGRSEIETWSLFLAGDVRLDADTDRDESLLSDSLRERVSSSDLAVANFEAPVATPDASPIPKSGPAIVNHPDAPRWLRECGFDAVTMANNHLMDYGERGMVGTLSACESADLEIAGVGKNRAAAVEPMTLHAEDGTEVAVVSCCEREFGVADEGAPGTAWSVHSSALETVERAAATHDVVVVAEHGGIEYVPFSPPARRERLRAFVDAGADLVVGHHPHVAQGWEEYEGALVFHSLGNFLFDGMADGNTSRALAVEARFDGGDLLGVDLVPTRVDDTVVHHLDSPEYLDYLHRSADITGSDDYRGHWQVVAELCFYERYSNWLRSGIGGTASRIGDPTDPDAHRPAWNPDQRRDELLVLLNVVRNESHRAVMTTALSLLAGETTDERTDDIEETVEELCSWTAR